MNIHRSIVVLALAAGVAVAAGNSVLAAPNPGHSKHLLMEDVSYTGAATLKVVSPSFKDGELIPYENTQFRGNVFPGLTWTRGPDGTRSYVVIFQGYETEGEHVGSTVIALTLFNVPLSVTTLGVGMTTPPAGATLGPNVRGLNKPYAGPHVKSSGKHRYFVQVFALDTVLPSDPRMTYDRLASGMTGHVLASGVLHFVSNKDPQSKED